MKKHLDTVCRHYTDGKSTEELIGNIGFSETVQVNESAHNTRSSVGEGSYIGETFRTYAAEHYLNNFTINVIDMLDPSWRDKSFSDYDIVYHVAGIAHADVGNVSNEVRKSIIPLIRIWL